MSNAVEAILNVARKELGVTESPRGSNRTKYGQWYGMNGQPWCFDGFVELLTEHGWIPFKQYDGLSRVAQVRQDNHEIELVSPINVIQKTYTGRGARISRRGINLTMDSGHRLWGYWKQSKNMGVPTSGTSFAPVSELLDKQASQVTIPCTHGNSLNEEYPVLEEDLILLAAFLADGFFHRGKLEFQVSRQDKIDMLSSFDPLNIYTAPKAYGISKKPLTTFTFKIPEIFNNFFSDYKVLRVEELYKLHFYQAETVLAYFAMFDGYKPSKNSYSVTQSRKDLIDAMQILALLCGRQSTVAVDPYRGAFIGEGKKQTYRLNYYLGEQKPTVIKSSQVKEVWLENHELYCVEVPSNVIIVRSENGGLPIAIGNCAIWTSWVYHQAGYPLPKIQPPCPSGAAYCPFIERYARQQGEWHSIPQPGDLALFHFGKRLAVHIGIVEKVHHLGRSFYCLEGNTSTKSQDNGGKVMRRKRWMSTVRGFYRPAVLGKSSPIVTPTSGTGEDAYWRLIRLTYPLMQGDDIRTWQKQMNWFRYGLEVDGVYGVDSEAACKDLQKKRGLEVDGVIGPDTWKESFSNGLAPEPDSTTHHTVVAGDTLFGISRKYKTTPEELIRINALKGDLIYPGMKLRLSAKQ